VEINEITETIILVERSVIVDLKVVE